MGVWLGNDSLAENINNSSGDREEFLDCSKGLVEKEEHVSSSKVGLDGF